MNRGNRIILVLGIAAAVVFALSLAYKLKEHYELREFHRTEYERVQRIAAPGSEWEMVKQKLLAAGFQLPEASDGTHDSDGTREFFCRWKTSAGVTAIQTERLGVPTAACIRVSPDGTVGAVTGL